LTVSVPRFESGTSWIRSRRSNHSIKGLTHVAAHVVMLPLELLHCPEFAAPSVMKVGCQ